MCVCIWVREATVILVCLVKLVAELLCDQISNGLHNVTADNSNDCALYLQDAM